MDLDEESQDIELDDEQIEALESFALKVSTDGFSHALKNSFPEELPRELKKRFKKLSTIEGEALLEEVMEQYGLE